MILLAVIASIGLIGLGVLVGLSAPKTNRTNERPIVLVNRPAVLIAFPRIDRVA